jgi:hypothetical protein
VAVVNVVRKRNEMKQESLGICLRTSGIVLDIMHGLEFSGTIFPEGLRPTRDAVYIRLVLGLRDFGIGLASKST